MALDPVDEVAFQVLQVVGLTLPIFILAIDVFTDEAHQYDRTRVFVSVVLLIGSAAGAIVLVLLDFNRLGAAWLDDSLLNASITLLATGYVGLAWSIGHTMAPEGYGKYLYAVAAVTLVSLVAIGVTLFFQ